MDRETATRLHLRGWLWASIAEEIGPLAAAADPLPENEEAEARRLANALGGLSPETAFAQSAADSLARKAVEDFRATLPFLRRMAAREPETDALRRGVNDAMRAAEWSGKKAAIAARALLLSRELEGDR